MKYPTQYCIYDFETTGLDTNTCSVIEIGAKRVHDDRHEIREWLVRPDDFDGTLPEKTVELTGITAADIEKCGVPEYQAFAEFAEFARGYPLMGHNIVRYDNLILGRLLKKHQLALYPDAKRSIDTAALYKGRKLGEPQLWHEGHYDWAERVLEIRRAGLKYKLELCCEELGIDVSDLIAHRATADVEMVDRVFRAMTASV